MTHKRKTELINWTLSKLKAFFPAQYPVKRTKRHTEKKCGSHTSDKGLVSKMYKELSKLNSRKKQQQSR